MAASAATIAELERDDGGVYRHMEEIGRALMDGIRDIAKRLEVPLLVQGLPTVLQVSFTQLPVMREYRDYALHADKERYEQFVVAMLRGKADRPRLLVSLCSPQSGAYRTDAGRR